jgi:hypothetical protein
MTTFELWNVESGNLLGSFATEDLALAAVREAVERNGRPYGELLALGCENSRGRSKALTSGRDLVNRAMQHNASATSVERRLAPS